MSFSSILNDITSFIEDDIFKPIEKVTIKPLGDVISNLGSAGGKVVNAIGGTAENALKLAENASKAAAEAPKALGGILSIFSNEGSFMQSIMIVGAIILAILVLPKMIGA
jgi:hypothetical protein